MWHELPVDVDRRKYTCYLHCDVKVSRYHTELQFIIVLLVFYRFLYLHVSVCVQRKTDSDGSRCVGVVLEMKVYLEETKEKQ